MAEESNDDFSKRAVVKERLKFTVEELVETYNQVRIKILL